MDVWDAGQDTKSAGEISEVAGPEGMTAGPEGMTAGTEGMPAGAESMPLAENGSPSGERFVRVIDFKRGQRNLSGAELQAGLQLQLMIYLAEALKMQKGRPAGVFYFRLDDAIFETQETAPSLVELERSKLLRMRGLPTRDRRVLDAMAPRISDILDVPTTGSGELFAGRGAEEGDFTLLIDHAVKTAGQQIDRIREGQTAPTPLRTPDTDPCRYCDFSAACMNAGETSAKKAERMSVADLIELLRAKREGK